MRLLAIDTALEACSVAVLDTVAGRLVATESIPMVRGHAEALMPMVARVMGRSGLDFADLSRIAVTVGPGSFTGLRVGLAAARGIALAAHKPIVGLTTLACYAAPAIAETDRIPVVAAIDARHGHVYVQGFSIGGRPAGPPSIIPAAKAVIAFNIDRPRLIGSGAALLTAAWSGPPPTSVDPRGAPDIGWVARLGAAAEEAATPPKPLYLRAPDAQPQDAARLARQ